jgi:hypothetical protein
MNRGKESIQNTAYKIFAEDHFQQSSVGVGLEPTTAWRRRHQFPQNPLFFAYLVAATSLGFKFC